ncbi:MAG: HAD family hydrolase [Spirochaetia bacterium]
MQIKAVAFDLDGTLYPNYRMYIHSLPFALTHLNLAIQFGKMRKVIRNIRPITDFREKQAQLLARRLSKTEEETKKIIDTIIYTKWEKSFRNIKPYPGVKETLIKLKAEGLKIGLMSDFPIKKKLEYLGLSGIWDCAFSSEECHYLKPNPEPFQKLVDCFDVPVDNILYVGNNYEYDVIGAAEFGMKTAFLSKSKNHQKPADITFRSFKDLLDQVLQHLNN